MKKFVKFEGYINHVEDGLMYCSMEEVYHSDYDPPRHLQLEMDIPINNLTPVERKFFDKHHSKDGVIEGLYIDLWVRYYDDETKDGHGTIRFPLYIWKKEDIEKIEQKVKELSEILGW